MKIVKWIITFTIVIAAYVVVSDLISPFMRVSSYDTQRLYGDKMTFNITIINFSPRPKEIPIGASDNADISLLVDGANAAQPIPKDKAVEIVTIPPLSNRTITRTLTLMPTDTANQAQTLSSTETALYVSPGQHSVRATWGSHASDVMTFGVR